MLSELPANSLGAYVISMAKTASDVLAVVLLQRECGVRDALRVVPLFETLDDLHNAPGTLRTLFASDWYLRHIGGTQECMIGYSDSGKDAGRMAAAWALFETQEALADVSGLDLLFAFFVFCFALLCCFAFCFACRARLPYFFPLPCGGALITVCF